MPFQAQGDKTPVFLVHAEEGEAVVFRYLADGFDPDRPLYSFNFCKASGKWDHPVTIEQIAGHYIKDIRSVQPEGPYILGGHCVGGLIAYEMAVQLTSENQSVSLVAMFDPLLPEAVQKEDLRKKINRNSMEYKSKQLKKYLAKKCYFYRNRIVNLVYQKSTVYFLKACSFRLMDHKQLISYARLSYQIKPYNGKVIYFKPGSHSKDTSDVSIRIWSKKAKNLSVISLNGNHNSILYEENAENTRRALESALNS